MKSETNLSWSAWETGKWWTRYLLVEFYIRGCPLAMFGYSRVSTYPLKYIKEVGMLSATKPQDRCRWPATVPRLWRQKWKSKANRNRTSAALRPNVGWSNWSGSIQAIEVEDLLFRYAGTGCFFKLDHEGQGFAILHISEIVIVGSWKWQSLIGKTCFWGHCKMQDFKFHVDVWGMPHLHISATLHLAFRLLGKRYQSASKLRILLQKHF